MIFAVSALISCTLVQVTDSSGARGSLQSVETSSGCLFPLLGPSTATTSLCNGKAVSEVVVRYTFGQFIWNSCLGIISTKYTVDYRCADGTAHTRQLDRTALALLEESGIPVRSESIAPTIQR